ncbi:hypothetical protein [Enterococcus casseliflavus]|uniref:hypothetical protein n=1 Tax=Enterococcus casseliflavus TaxID=37734 RepID=UPI003D0A5305
MSLVYNNKKLIGKCSKFAIEKVQGTSPFVMLENFEPKQPQLNENQQIVLEWLKKQYFQGYGPAIIITIHLLQKLNDIDVLGDEPVTKAYRALNTAGEAVVVKMFAAWAQEQEEE